MNVESAFYQHYLNSVCTSDKFDFTRFFALLDGSILNDVIVYSYLT